MKKAFIEPEIADYCPVSSESIFGTVRGCRYKVHPYRVRKKLKKRRQRFMKYPVFNRDIMEKMDLAVVFSPYATSHHAKKWSLETKTPMLHLELGFLPKSILCDIKGFWGESSIIDSIGSILDEMGEEKSKWSEEYSKYLIKNNISKRKQPDKNTKIDGEFVFLPMQYMADQSILRFCNMKYTSFIKQVTVFCKDHGLKLAIKKHPHAYRKEAKDVDKIFRVMKKRFGNTLVPVDGSIHWFCQNCVFMSGMNTGSIIDGLVNNCVISHCGQSLFMNSGAVVHDDNPREGLERALCLSKEEKLVMFKRQKLLLYYLYNRYLLLEEDTHNSEFSNDQKVKNQLKLIGKIDLWK